MVVENGSASRRRSASSRLPSLDSLRAFEAVARHRSFTTAALELHVTQSAVSQRIRALELELGAALFRRTSHGLEATNEGTALAGAMRRALAEIVAGMAAFDADAGKALTVTVAPSFATRWLVPRLARFRERHPGIEVRVDADPRLALLRDGEADLGIRYGLGNYPGLRTVRLMGDTAQPVLSPRLLQRFGAINDPGMLSRLPLIHDTTDAASGANWAHWLAHVGRPDLACDAGPRFSDSVLAMQAAAAGLGVAIARTSLIGEDLASGGLVALFPPPVPINFSYWLVTLPEAADKPRIAAFCAWLQEEARRPPGRG